MRSRYAGGISRRMLMFVFLYAAARESSQKSAAVAMAVVARLDAAKR